MNPTPGSVSFTFHWISIPSSLFGFHHEHPISFAMNRSMSERSRNEAARTSPPVRSDGQNQNKGQDGTSSLLKSLETNLEDLRTLITCRVCIRPLYEPYTISCGHTFCYSCLRQWFDRDRAQKTCPDCRAKVVKQPAPAYLVSTIYLCLCVTTKTHLQRSEI